jgi:hypothetical protein
VEKILAGQNKRRVLRRLMQGTQGGGVWQRFLTSCTVNKLGLKTRLEHEDKNIPMQKMPSLSFH